MSDQYEIGHEWEEPDGLLELLNLIREQSPEANVRRIRYAYYYAELMHKGQKRQSGEPYIVHPLAVATTIAELRMDEETIVAGLLHDTLEDAKDAKREDIDRLFGSQVLSLVDGVTKLEKKHQPGQSDRETREAESNRAIESLRKMLLAVAKDMRVMVIKLADRLHNMATLDSLPPAKRTRIAAETLDVYAPLAARLGIWQIKWQLEDLAFKALHPAEYEQVSELVRQTRGERERELSTVIRTLKEGLEKRGMTNFEVTGRPKHLYSIFNKMNQQNLKFEEIHDLLGVRIILEDRDSCYLAFGVLHSLYVPVAGLFTDYIAHPKPNGYQSLHTKVVGPGGQSLEVQIRTREMHRVAEYGVAAHWTYKEGTDQAPAEGHEGLQNLRQRLIDWSSEGRLSADFRRNVFADLFSEQVFVSTPKGDVLDLPSGSTPVDAAFRVHTEIGMTLVGAKVNGIIVPLNRKLENGDVIQLITRANAVPSQDWLEFVRSAQARLRLKSFFRKKHREQDAQRGRMAVERELSSMGIDPRLYLGEERLKKVLGMFDGIESPLDLLAHVGAGRIGVRTLINKLRGGSAESDQGESIKLKRTLEGKLTFNQSGGQSVLVSRAKCCSPIPGDEVVGYVTRGRGIMIHRKVCPNAQAYQAAESARLLPYEWPPDGSLYQVDLKVVAINRAGLLMDVSTILGESKTNLSAARVRTLPNQTAEIEMSIDVSDTAHLAAMMTKISNFSDVISVFRLFGKRAPGR